ncbi:MAG: hypothetical protein MUC56_00180 [Thermoanaerobaculales bacterium]|jgi:hypothetical protein|nr:hypothetical protein [Thermoanaerobaculales bacterium]
MRCLIIVSAVVLTLAAPLWAQGDAEQASGDQSITHGEFSQMVIDIALGWEEATPDPATSLEKLKLWNIAPTTWEVDELLTHGELSQIAAQVGIEYLPARPDSPVSRVFVEALLWREVGKLRDYMAKRLGHGFSANHVLDAGVDRAVSPSDFD